MKIERDVFAKIIFNDKKKKAFNIYLNEENINSIIYQKTRFNIVLNPADYIIEETDNTMLSPNNYIITRSDAEINGNTISYSLGINYFHKNFESIFLPSIISITDLLRKDCLFCEIEGERFVRLVIYCGSKININGFKISKNEIINISSISHFDIRITPKILPEFLKSVSPELGKLLNRKISQAVSLIEERYISMLKRHNNCNKIINSMNTIPDDIKLLWNV